MAQILEYVIKYGLDFHVGPHKEGFLCVITWASPPWHQGIARGHRALIVNAEGTTPEECINKAAEDLRAWFDRNGGKIERSLNNEQN